MGRAFVRRQALALTLVTVLSAALQPSISAAASAAQPQAHRTAGEISRLDRRVAAPPRLAVPGSFVVQLAEGVEAEDLFGGVHGKGPQLREYHNAINGFAAALAPGTVRRLSRDPRVVSIEPDLLYTAHATQAAPAWGLDRIDQRRRPLDASYTYARSGRGVSVYVLDSGVWARHGDFGDRVARGFDSLGTRSTDDCVGHGTHVASTAAGRQWGVAKSARIIPVRVGCQEIRLRYLLDGLDYIVRHHRSGTPAVVNISIGGPGSDTFDLAVRRVLNDGVTVVASAGNDGMNACRYSPARVPGVITVGATNRYDGIARWSSYGSCIDLFAPGVDIRAAAPGARSRSVVMSGTSMAAPHITGAVARYLDTFPRATPAAVSSALTDQAVGGLSGLYKGDPNRLLNVAGRTPTALTQSVSAATVPYGDPITLTGVLRNRLTGKVLAGHTLALMHRPQGTSVWRQITTRETGSTGRVRITTVPTTPGEWRLRLPASGYGAPSTSATSTVGVRALVAIALSATTVEPSGAVTITGTVAPAGAGGTAAIQQSNGSGWDTIADAPYGADGALSYDHVAGGEGTYRYRVFVPQTATTTEATSSSVTLTVLCTDGSC